MVSEELDLLSKRPIAGLIADPLCRDHEWFRAELDRMVELASRIAESAGGDPILETGVPELLRELREVITNHIDSEELVVFPLLESGQASRAQDAIRGLELEHRDIERVAERFHHLSSKLDAPTDAGPGWLELRDSFTAFEERKRLHNRIEGEILFPRVLYADADATDRADGEDEE